MAKRKNDFWIDKTPCWKIRACAVFEKCHAYLNPELPCWEIPNTACDEILNTPKSCFTCKVYKIYKTQ